MPAKVATELSHAVEFPTVRGFGDRCLSYCGTYFYRDDPRLAPNKGDATCPTCVRGVKANIVRDARGDVYSRNGVVDPKRTPEAQARRLAALAARLPRPKSTKPKAEVVRKVHYFDGCPASLKDGATITGKNEGVTCTRCIKQIERTTSAS